MRIIDQGNYGSSGKIVLDDFLSKPLFCHLATIGAGGPCDSPLWFLWENNALWFIANQNDSFPQRISIDHRAAAGIVDFDVQSGRVNHVGFRGSASVELWDASRAQRLLRRYLGADAQQWDLRFRSTIDDETNRWVRLVPDTVVVRDQTYSVGVSS
jgi:hypothetical protein